MKTMMRDSLFLMALGLLLVLLLGSGSAVGAPLAAFADHSGEDHSFDSLKHKNEYLEGIILSGADLTQTNFMNATLRGAIMISAILTDANLMNADLTGADLTNALMSGVNAKNADFTNATLDGVFFPTGDIKNAIFIGASLLGADLSSLINADKAIFVGAVYDAATLLAPGMDTSFMTLVPEPSPAILLLFGLCGLQAGARRLEER